eukprot:CAMPEP_0119133192 /NCGR_PEP_ID=MMETSP1310-20130426/13227_1 /TAXON_ID=464262 /ORGANISM="Genus nov. species nov., Strain RCC2339" /LENGTH=66 /DNA_ID=CAMNT_0007123877 /DNA_START=53 /DNA_END=253 /DNA_ORIENTATION=+
MDQGQKDQVKGGLKKVGEPMEGADKGITQNETVKSIDGGINQAVNACGQAVTTVVEKVTEAINKNK